MRFGLTLPSFTWPGLDYPMTHLVTKEMARRAEALGFASLTVWDHLLSAPGMYAGSWLDPLMVLGCAAGATDRIELGTHVLVAPIRHPVLLAKELATLDSLSGGRFFLGVGTGWNEPEFTSMGISIRERGRRTDELLDALKLLLTESDVTFEGRFYRFENVTIEPRPERYFPIWVGGGSRVPDPMSPDQPHMVKGVLDRIARHADVFTCRAAGKAQWVGRDFDAVTEHLRAVGRDPKTLGFAHVQAGYLVDTADRERALERQRGPMETLMGTHRSWEHLQDSYLVGSVDDVVERLKRLEAMGVEQVTIQPAAPEMAQLDLWMERVIEPYFR